jgi:hypothetical protein
MPLLLRSHSPPSCAIHFLTTGQAALHCKMRNWFRDGFYLGLGLALVLSIYLLRLWGAEHQVRLHSEHLIRAIENKSWPKFATFIADDYQDQWGQDHAQVLERTRDVFRYVRGIRLVPGYAMVQAGDGKATWQAKITLEGGDNELGAMIKERVNPLPTPFTFEWRKRSWKPWDWKLVRVSNPGLEIPAGFEG